MDFSHFNFEHDQWLWALNLIPLLWLVFLLEKGKRQEQFKLERFADKHLLPFLLKKLNSKVMSWSKKNLALWSLIWTLGVLAVAGPRWDFKEIRSYKPNKNLVILLDLSNSMDAGDLQPSRLVRARQKIEDILNESPDVNIGLIAFAEDAHLITPITEDKQTIRHLLNALRTDLVYVPGSRLSPALALAEQLLSAIPSQDQAILLMSDGDFEDPSSVTAVKALAARGIKLSAMGFGTAIGAPVPTGNGGFIESHGHVVMAKLNKEQMQLLSDAGEGRYLNPGDALYGGHVFFNNLAASHSSLEEENGTIKDWDPRFYIFLVPLLMLMLTLFRRQPSQRLTASAKNVLLALVLGIAVIPELSRADDLKDGSSGNRPGHIQQLFKNQATRGGEALAAQDYETAVKDFDDPYRRGVAQYKAGQMAAAEQSFRASRRPEVEIDSKYNLGNTLAEEGKYEEAVKAYEEVLAKQPQHEKATANLKIVRNLLKKQNHDEAKKEDRKQNQNKAQAQSQNPTQAPSQDHDQNQGQNQTQAANQEHNQSQNQNQTQTQNRGQNQRQNHDQAQTQKQNINQAENKNKKASQVQSDSQETAQREKKDPQSENGSGQREEKLAQKEKELNQKESGLGDREKLGGNNSASLPDTQKVAKQTQQDIDADQWLNRISNDPHSFLKNQFFIESSRLQTQKGERVW